MADESLQAKTEKAKPMDVKLVSSNSAAYVNVILVDVDMHFMKMVMLLIKLSVAAIPAFIILSVIGFEVWANLFHITFGMSKLGGA